jgi:hypothetical protein
MAKLSGDPEQEAGNGIETQTCTGEVNQASRALETSGRDPTAHPTGGACYPHGEGRRSFAGCFLPGQPG